jgi:hypothetical protein
MEKRVGDANKHLKIGDVKGELNLRFERLNMKAARNEEGKVLEEQALFSGQLKGKFRNCGQVGKNCSNRNVGQTETEPEQISLVLSQTWP